MYYILCIAISYLIGSFQISYHLCKLIKKKDIREFGEKNTGAANAFTVVGAKTGILCFLCDAGKGALAVFVSVCFFSRANVIMMLVAGIFCVIGHNFPFYMHFKGGKGVAVTLGVFLMIDYRVFAFAAIPALIILLITGLLSVASLSFELIVFVFMVIFNIGSSDLLITALLTSAFTIITFYEHRTNIERIIDGTEPRLGKHKKQTRQIMSGLFFYIQKLSLFMVFFSIKELIIREAISAIGYESQTYSSTPVVASANATGTSTTICLVAETIRLYRPFDRA